MPPKLSVSILTYNQAGFIAEAIESVLAQKVDFPIEICIGDDCSTDGTRDILRRYRERYPEIIRLNLQPSHPPGIPGRVNNVTNLTSCRGELIAMLDGDDYWRDEGKLQEQVDFLEAHPGHSATAHDAICFDESSARFAGKTLSERLLGHKPPRIADFTFRDVSVRLIFQTSSLCFRKALLLPFPDWFMKVHSADVAIFLMLSRAGPIHYVDRPLSVYRVHSESVCSSLFHSPLQRSKRALSDFQLFTRHLSMVPSRRKQAELYKNMAIIHFAEGRYLRAIQNGAAMLRTEPRRFAQAFANSLRIAFRSRRR